MPSGSGILAQFGYAAETTWGSYQVPDHFVEIVADAMALTQPRVDSKGLRSGARVQRSTRFITPKKSVGGQLDFEVASKGFGLMFKHWLGAVVTSTAPGGTTSKRHRCTIADPFGLGLTLQLGRPSSDGTVQPFSYTGCKITDGELLNSVSGYLEFKPVFVGQNETLAQGLAAASYAATDELLSFAGGSVTIGGSSVANVKDISIKVNTGLAEDRYFLSGSSSLRQQPISNAFVAITGTMTCEFAGLTEYNRFVNGTLAGIVATWSGFTALEGAIFPQVVVNMPVCRFDGATPNLAGQGIVDLKLAFVALDDGSQVPITLDYISLDSAP